MENGVPVYCRASDTNVQKLEKVQLSAARIITSLRNTCPRDIVPFEADLLPHSLRRRACLTKYYNKLRSLYFRNRTSAYFKDWCNNQRFQRNSPFSQMVSFNLNVGAVEPYHMSQCLDPVDDLDGVFFHPELPVHVNKQTDLPAYLRQLVLDIPTDAFQVYTDGSRDNYYRSGSRIYIKSQDHKNPEKKSRWLISFLQ
ncbi:reverse transcriptase domain-containing protein [Trichonephila clavipes]|uniref:Reverse transcriptase domain-containing protein n=1 Tax=Trichonephila clavipes TaxID=2585209 RepID=A0A8X6UZV8_TRICX|nr:reverse transcriptase domain-containing protein [Trichonephila clavipes]